MIFSKIEIGITSIKDYYLKVCWFVDVELINNNTFGAYNYY